MDVFRFIIALIAVVLVTRYNKRYIDKRIKDIHDYDETDADL